MSLSAELKGDKVHSFLRKLKTIGDTEGPQTGVPGDEMIAVKDPGWSVRSRLR